MLAATLTRCMPKSNSIPSKLYQAIKYNFSAVIVKSNVEEIEGAYRYKIKSIVQSNDNIDFVVRQTWIHGTQSVALTSVGCRSR